MLTSETYILEVDIGFSTYDSRITVYKREGSKILPVNTIYGEEAENLYFSKLRKGRSKQ